MKELGDDWVMFTYLEHRSKNNQPGLQSVNREQKKVDHTCRIDDERDVFVVLNEYLKHVPRRVKEANDENPVRLLNHLKQNLKVKGPSRLSYLVHPETYRKELLPETVQRIVHRQLSGH